MCTVQYNEHEYDTMCTNVGYCLVLVAVGTTRFLNKKATVGRCSKRTRKRGVEIRLRHQHPVSIQQRYSTLWEELGSCYVAARWLSRPPSVNHILSTSANSRAVQCSSLVLFTYTPTMPYSGYTSTVFIYTHDAVAVLARYIQEKEHNRQCTHTHISLEKYCIQQRVCVGRE